MKNKAQVVLDSLKEAEGDFTPQEKELINTGYIHIRDSHMFGDAPLFKKGNDYKFVYQGKVMTPQEIYDDLVQNWDPQSEEEVSWKMDSIKGYFKAFGIKD